MFLLKLGSELQNLVKKFAVQYENINKLQTAFPRSGMHRGPGFVNLDIPNIFHKPVKKKGSMIVPIFPESCGVVSKTVLKRMVAKVASQSWSYESCSQNLINYPQKI